MATTTKKKSRKKPAAKKKADKSWPADEVVRRKASDLIPYARNARKHSDEQIGKIAASIREWGWTMPALVDEENNVIAGHCRILAAQRLGIKEIPCLVAKGWTEAQRRAYVIADNQLTLDARWDKDMLKIELGDLKDLDFDLGLTGFDPADLDMMFNSGIKEDEDTVPPIPDEPVAKRGQLWALGNHRLLCGDSTDAKDIARVMAGKKAVLLATDPPYCVDYTGDNRPKKGEKETGKDWSDKYDEVSIGDLGEFLRSVFNATLPNLKENAGIYIWHAHLQYPIIDQVFEEFGILCHQPIIWVKPSSTFTYSYYRWSHEPCLFGWKQGHKPPHYQDNTMSSVWEVDWEGKKRIVGNEHPTQKPVRLFEIPMEQHTKPGDIVLETFSGSGSQLIAAEKRERKCRALEISPAFVDVAIARWEKFTGKKAKIVKS